jgi:hypothetical protein
LIDYFIKDVQAAGGKMSAIAGLYIKPEPINSIMILMKSLHKFPLQHSSME